MALTRKQLTMGIALTLLSSAVVYIIVNKIRKKRMINQILKQLESGVNSYGSVEDVQGLDGAEYRKTVPANLDIIKLKEDKVKEYAEKIYDSYGYTYDDEEAPMEVLRQLRDQYALSQVASWFYGKYKVTLRQYMKEQMSESELDEAFDIMRTLKAYTVAK